MKKLLLSFIVITSFTGTAQILSEGFESATFPPSGWTRASTLATTQWNSLPINLDSGPPAITTVITGTKSAAIQYVAQDVDADLISPAFSLVGYSDATFTFNAKIGYEYMVDPANAAGDLLVQVSTDDATWTTLWVEEDQGLFDDYEVLAISLDLTPYVGESSVKIRFRYSANDADSLSVDDIEITGTLGVSDVLASSFKTFPNPVNNVVNISNANNILLTDVRVTDINGRTVKTINANNVSEVQINVADLSAGVYFLNINSDAGTAVKRIVKN